MPVRRAQGGGMFGGPLERMAPPTADYSPILGTLFEGASKIMRDRAAIIIAKKNQEIQQQQRAQDFELRQRTQVANEQYRQATLQRQRENDATNQARVRDNDWNANASRNRRDALAEEAAARAAAKAQQDAKVLRPGMPGYVEMQGQLANTRAAANARHRAPRIGGSDPAAKARETYVARESSKLMNAKVVDGRDVPGLSPEDAIAEANRRYDLIRPAQQPAGAAAGTSNTRGLGRTAGVTPASGAAPARIALSPRDRQAALNDPEYAAYLASQGYTKGRDW